MVNKLSFASGDNGNSNLYSFLATDYDINTLANQIYAKNNMARGLLTLKNLSNSEGNIATA